MDSPTEAPTATPAPTAPSGNPSGEQPQPRQNAPRNRKKKPAQDQKPKGNSNTDGPAHKPSAKLRGMEKDSPTVRLSKTLSWLLRHGAQSEGLPIRADGYVKVTDLLENAKIKSQALDLAGLQEIVNADSKQRYDLKEEEGQGWWIKAKQGHSIRAIKLELVPILSVADIPTGTAVHGTTKKAWESISNQGLSRMKRNHIHLAQGVAGDSVISGMRTGSQILIFVDVQKAIDAGFKFHFSANGVVLTEGNEKGFLPCEYFLRVEDAKRLSLPGWEGTKDASAPDTS